MAQCDRIDCQETATHEVVLVVPSADGSPSTEGELGIHLCAEHAAETDCWGFDSIAWAIELMMRELGFPEPDASTAYAKPVPISAEMAH